MLRKINVIQQLNVITFMKLHKIENFEVNIFVFKTLYTVTGS